MSRAARGVTRDTDPKLAALVEELVRIARQADKEGIDDDDRRRKRKVLIFSFYEDTIDWVEDFLRDRVQHDVPGWRPTAAASPRWPAGSRATASAARTPSTASPRSPGAPPAGRARTRPLRPAPVYRRPRGRHEPPAVPQRHQLRPALEPDAPGAAPRPDRPHRQPPRPRLPAHFFPDQQLNRLLDLEIRVRRKLAQAAASVGVEVAPSRKAQRRDQSFTETREEIESCAGRRRPVRGRRHGRRRPERRGVPPGAAPGPGRRRGRRSACTAAGSGWSRASSAATSSASPSATAFTCFVPAAGGPLVREVATCLRPHRVRRRHRARRAAGPGKHGLQRLGARRRTSSTPGPQGDRPANLHPRISRLNRTIADYLRRCPPVGVEKGRGRCLEAIEAPCSRRDENRCARSSRANNPAPGPAPGRWSMPSSNRPGTLPGTSPAAAHRAR